MYLFVCFIFFSFPLLLIEIEGGRLKSVLFALNLYGFSLEKAKEKKKSPELTGKEGR